MGLIDLRVGINDGRLPTCLPLRIGLSAAAPHEASKSTYHHHYPHSLTVFVIGGSQEMIPPERRRFRDIFWTVTYPVGTKVVLGLTDGDGRLAPWSLRSSRVLLPNVSSGRILKMGRLPDGWRFDAVGGNEQYQLSSLSTREPASYQINMMSMSITSGYTSSAESQSDRSTRHDAGKPTRASVADATGSWASGTGVSRFRGRSISPSEPNSIGTIIGSQVPSAGLLEGVAERLRTDYAKAESQNVLQRRDSPTNSQGLTTILIVDIVALALLLLGAALCAIQAVLKRRARRRGGSNGKTSGIPLGNVNDHDVAERHPPAIVSSSPRSSTLRRQSLATESVLSRYSLKPEEMDSPPPVPPTTPTTANFTESPLPTPLSMSSTPSTWPGVTPQLTSFPDAAYGDPYPSPSVSGGGRRQQHKRSTQLSFSSFASVRAAKAISRLARFSKSAYPDEPALSDAHSAVLARQASGSSSRTMKKSSRNTLRPGTASSQNEQDSPVESNESPVGSASPSRTDWYQVSEDAPAMPPLVFRHGDLHIPFR
ncbi:unnamed protein product [Cyclocybe aegerita]|uniref:Uncharacterized protein n=1 Tax=Cyclocybe aegerita TaxID=1973307 RepID=A0A8S0XJ49_CYCAE|nr:unnamed protein product [Cyclocybe aegerita]